MREQGLSSIYVIDRTRQLKGYVNANDVLEARNNQITSLKEIIRDDMPTVEKETPIQEIFDVIHDSPVPVAVTEEGKLRGIIIKGNVNRRLGKCEWKWGGRQCLILFQVFQ